MQIKLVPAHDNPTPKNLLKVKMQYMHGDADAYTHETFNINIPSSVENVEYIISKIMTGIELSMEIIEYECDTPFIVSDEDWNSSNMDEVTGIPITGAKLKFKQIIKHKWFTETLINVGTVVSATDSIVNIEYNGNVYEVPNDDSYIAPETAIAVIVDGNEASFMVDDIKVKICGVGDVTNDGQTTASASFDEVEFFDENGKQFYVLGY